MDLAQLFTHHPSLKKYWLPLVLALSGLLFIGYGIVASIGSGGKSGEVVFETAADEESNPIKTDTNATILVDVAGGVVAPGVYKLAKDARVQDALVAASGLSEKANRDWVAKNLNLASRLTDGIKLYIPVEGEQEVMGVTHSTSSGFNKQININTASASELDTLSGVGPVTSQKIIDNRPYGSIEELLSKKVVSKSVFEKIKGSIAAF